MYMMYKEVLKKLSYDELWFTILMSFTSLITTVIRFKRKREEGKPDPV